MTKLRTPYKTNTKPKIVQVRISANWHKILLRLWQMEREGRPMAIVMLGGDKPRCCLVGDAEG